MTVLSLVIVATLAQTAPLKCIVVPEWTRVQVKPELASFFSDHLASSLRNHHFKVVTANEISTLLGAERERQLLGCKEASTSCMAELGNALGCDGTLLANLAKLEDTFRVHLKVLRSSDGAVLAETKVEASGENKLLDALDSAGARLSDLLRPEPPSASGPRQLAWIPGVVALAGLGVGGVCIATSRGQYQGVVDAIARDHLVTPATRSLADSGAGLQTAGFVVAGLGVVAAGAAVAMFVLGAEPPVKVSGLVTPAGLSVALGGTFP